MMHPVMGGSDQKIFEYAGFVYFFCMDKYAPCLSGGINKCNVDRLESQPGDRNKKDEAVQGFHDRGPETNRQIELGR